MSADCLVRTASVMVTPATTPILGRWPTCEGQRQECQEQKQHIDPRKIEPCVDEWIRRSEQTDCDECWQYCIGFTVDEQPNHDETAECCTQRDEAQWQKAETKHRGDGGGHIVVQRRIEKRREGGIRGDVH